MGTGTVQGTQLRDLINQWSWSPQQAFDLTPPVRAPDNEVRKSADELIRNKGALPPAVQQMVEGLLASPGDQKFDTLQGQLTSNDILSRVVDQYSPQSIGSLGGPLFANAQPTSWNPDGAGSDEPKKTKETEEPREEKKPEDELGQRLLHAVAGQESGGDPTVINTDAASADGYGIGAIGRYQMLGSNVAAWSREAADAGKIPDEIADRLKADPKAITGMPEIQDEIAAFKMEQYYQSGKDQGYSADEAVRFVAAAWYSGDGNNLNSDAPQAGYPSIRQYTEEVLEKFEDA